LWIEDGEKVICWSPDPEEMEMRQRQVLAETRMENPSFLSLEYA
jgi:hypothetical protein